MHALPFKRKPVSHCKLSMLHKAQGILNKTITYNDNYRLGRQQSVSALPPRWQQCLDHQGHQCSNSTDSWPSHRQSGEHTIHPVALLTRRPQPQGQQVPPSRRTLAMPTRIRLPPHRCIMALLTRRPQPQGQQVAPITLHRCPTRLTHGSRHLHTQYVARFPVAMHQ